MRYKKAGSKIAPEPIMSYGRILVVLLSLSTWLIAYHAPPAYAHIVKDMHNVDVSITASSPRIADLWHAHNEITLMLGGGRQIDATAENPHDSPLLFELDPHLKTVPYGLNAAYVNREYLLRQHIDVAFTASSLQAEYMRDAHIPALASLYLTFDDMLRSIDMTALVLNTPYSFEKARLYRSALTQTRHDIGQRLAGITQQRKPKVLHISRLSPLLVDGQDTLIDAWIRESGGRNVASMKGNRRPTNLEHILSWNPDIIIIESANEELPPHSLLFMTNAGKKGKIWRNPRGIFAWDRYGCEILLQLLWAAQHFHPDRFYGLDMDREMRNFYATFFSYHPSDVQRQNILKGKAG